MKNSIFYSLRLKLILGIFLLFTVVGVLIYVPLSIILPKKIVNQILKRDIEITKFVSNEAKKLLLLNDKVSLSLLLHENLQKLEDAQYLFIQNPDGSILSHTFFNGFPKGLLSFRLKSGSLHHINTFINDNKKIYDIAVPVLNENLGVLHLGVSMESCKKDIEAVTKINDYIGVVILSGLGIGILIFLIIGFMFSEKIIKLKNMVLKISSGDLDATINIKSKDEIGILAKSFNEMTLSLKNKIREIKKLNIIEERNRIALALHDGCAQDMVSIIKRIELCEKLLEIDSGKTLMELNELKNISKDILNHTRHTIFDLKVSDDFDFNFLESLKNYIIKYQKQTNINVKSIINHSINKLLAEKSKIIFNIIIESLTNIRKHSHAKNVKINIDINNSDKVFISIKDDGIGFNVNNAFLNVYNHKKLGLISIRLRTNSLGGAFYYRVRFKKWY